MTVTILVFDYYTFDVLTACGPDIPPEYPSNIPPTSKICVKTALLREPWSDVGFRVLSAANAHYTRFLGSEDSGRVRCIPDASGYVEGLKIRRWQHRKGSTPFFGTKRLSVFPESLVLFHPI
jgi:hypothetical protein